MSRPDPVQRAIRLARAGRTHEARILIRRTLKANPGNAPAWALLAHLTYDPEDPARTIYCLEQLLRLQPDNLRAREHLHYLTSPVWKRYYDGPSSPIDLPEVDEPGGEQEEPQEEEQLRAERQRNARRRVLVGLLRSSATLMAIAVLVWWLAPGIPLFRQIFAALVGAPNAASAADSGDLSPTPRARDGILGLLTFPPLTGIRPFSPSPVPPTPTTMPIGTPTATLSSQVDYEPLAQALTDLHRQVRALSNYDLGIAFVDIQTGQMVEIDGHSRFHAMSTFKGPLAVYYLWLLERGQMAEGTEDRRHLTRMLEYSANPDTTCIFERVGGIGGFNDWLAFQGFSRENNFVMKWQDWGCFDSGSVSTPEPDWRYSRGDSQLGLPGGSALLACPIPQMPCDKAFAPADLATFYANLYRGGVISPAYAGLALEWLQEERAESLFLQDLPEQAGIRVYIKGGAQQANDEYRENFISEAGIVETPNGAFALAVFMQRNPEWPGSWPISEIARLCYEYFLQVHPEPLAPEN